MNKNNISVLMSVYYKDDPVFFKEALQSLENQTLKAQETIIVCDGKLSPELYEVIEEFKDSLNIIKVQNETNQGLAQSLNNGLEQVHYDLIARMDADDISVPNRFEQQVKSFSSSDTKEPIDVVGGYVHEFNGNVSNLISIRYVPKNSSEIKKFSKFRSPLNHPTVMIRTATLKEVGGYSTSFNKLEDYALWISLLAKGYNIVNIPDVLLYMRVSNDMYERRGGLKQAEAFFNLRKEMHKIGYINNLELVSGVLINVVISLSNRNFRKFMYKIIRKYK